MIELETKRARRTDPQGADGRPRGVLEPVSYELQSVADIDRFTAKGTAMITNVPGPKDPVDLAGTRSTVLVWPRLRATSESA